MNKFSYFNDTQKVVHLHTATQIHGTECDMSPIQPLEIREFILPEGTYPWVKQWKDGTLLVSPTRDDASDGGKPKHFGKYPIEFSFSNKETGKKMLEHCEEQLKKEDLDLSVRIMYIIMREQFENHLKGDE
jgi:hypothetical protein